jgi:hypothetical protein
MDFNFFLVCPHASKALIQSIDEEAKVCRASQRKLSSAGLPGWCGVALAPSLQRPPPSTNATHGLSTVPIPTPPACICLHGLPSRRRVPPSCSRKRLAIDAFGRRLTATATPRTDMRHARCWPWAVAHPGPGGRRRASERDESAPGRPSRRPHQRNRIPLSPERK